MHECTSRVAHKDLHSGGGEKSVSCASQERQSKSIVTDQRRTV